MVSGLAILLILAGIAIMIINARGSWSNIAGLFQQGHP